MADATPKKTSTNPKPAPKAATPKPSKAAKSAPKVAPAKAPTKGAPTPPGGATNPYDVVFHPVVTEKTMFNMDKNNSLEFLVANWASKPQIASAIEQLFTVKVHKVTTRFTRDGKRAVVRFAEGYSAEDIGMRVGVF